MSTSDLRTGAVIAAWRGLGHLSSFISNYNRVVRVVQRRSLLSSTMRLTPTFATLLALLSFSSISTAADLLNQNVIRVSLERKSFITHPIYNLRDLATRANNGAGYVNKDFLKTHVTSVAM